MASNEDKPRLPQRRGRKAPGELPDGFEPIVPLFRRSKAPAAAEQPNPARPLPRGATPPIPAPPAAPAPRLPEPAKVVAGPTPRDSSHARLLAAVIALIPVLVVVVAIMLLG
ncbi:hypothetical protein [Nocardioides sp. B-3]|uniref:hypothetical protein n=1 Tax=Nocardioides sp. B-3 TaxID=2895565 RepID=UPI002153516B|nr:hypothetical protein [Nocardioides sp. B-3]UUZ59015.1 hypothetical protein LP418_23990 [Nocardioides sp. B-3]